MPVGFNDSASKLVLVIRCRTCGEEIDTWELDPVDPATHVYEIASDLDFNHECAKQPDEKKEEP